VDRLVFAQEEVKYQQRNANQPNLRGLPVEAIVGLVVFKGTLRKFDPVERSLSELYILVNYSCC
jgi:hypothetical protein